MRKEKPNKYKSNNRVNLTYLKYQDRRKLGKKVEGKKIEEIKCCPYCKSEAGYYIEALSESLTRFNFDFTGQPTPKNEVTNQIWENRNYLCIDCGKALAPVEKD